MSPTVSTSECNRATATVTTTSAISVANASSGLTNLNTAHTATVPTATRHGANCQAPMWAKASMNLRIVLWLCGLYPVASPITPAMIWTAMPVVKPVITALETKFMIEPNFRRPSSSITTPTTSASAATFAGSAGSRPVAVNTLRDDSANALVNVVTINTVRAKTEPRIVDAMPE
jgi:hypothetical protein